MTGGTRRDFLKNSGRTALALAGGLTLEGLLSGCSTIGFREKAPVNYPPLKGHKIQPPHDGCLVGFFELGSYDCYNAILKKPSIILLLGSLSITRQFLKEDAGFWTRRGIIPFAMAHYYGYKMELIVEGKEERNIAAFAEGLRKYGEKYGGFFFTTMQEMNGYWFPWCQKRKLFKDTWHTIWNIFERNGTNEYATWVWESYCPEGPGSKVDNPEPYYPGDRYVDWIGLSAYSRSMFPTTEQHFASLVRKTYADMRKNHPEKPIMQSEFGKTRDPYQAQWLKQAFETIKSWPGIKAAIYWSNLTTGPLAGVAEGDNHSLNEESCEALREILKDPYWIMAK